MLASIKLLEYNRRAAEFIRDRPVYIILYLGEIFKAIIAERGDIMTHGEAKLFPERLLIAIHRRKITQRELAERIGVSPKVISKYVRGRSTPTLDTLYKIADALDVSVDWLLGRTNEPAEFHATEIEDEFKPQVKILYRALKDGSKPSTKTLMMLAEAIIREREEAEKEQGGKDS